MHNYFYIFHNHVSASPPPQGTFAAEDTLRIILLIFLGPESVTTTCMWVWLWGREHVRRKDGGKEGVKMRGGRRRRERKIKGRGRRMEEERVIREGAERKVEGGRSE